MVSLDLLPLVIEPEWYASLSEIYIVCYFKNFWIWIVITSLHWISR